MTSLNDFGKIQDTDGLDERSTKEFDTAYDSIDRTYNTEDSTDSSYIDTTTEITTAILESKLDLAKIIQEYKLTRRRKPLRHYFKYFSGSKHRDNQEGFPYGNSNEGDRWQSNVSSDGNDKYNKWTSLHSINELRHHTGFGLEDESGKSHKKTHTDEGSYGSVGELYDRNGRTLSHTGFKDWVASRSDSQLRGKSDADSYEKWGGVHPKHTNRKDSRISNSKTFEVLHSNYNDNVNGRRVSHTPYNRQGLHSDSKKERRSYSKSAKRQSLDHHHNNGRNVDNHENQPLMQTHNGRSVSAESLHEGQSSRGDVHKSHDDHYKGVKNNNYNNNKTNYNRKKKKPLSLITFKQVDYNNNINNNNNAEGAVNYNDIGNINRNGNNGQDKCVFIVCVAVYLNDAKFSPYGEMPKTNGISPTPKTNDDVRLTPKTKQVVTPKSTLH